jgi:hypothetical protein
MALRSFLRAGLAIGTQFHWAYQRRTSDIFPNPGSWNMIGLAKTPIAATVGVLFRYRAGRVERCTAVVGQDLFANFQLSQKGWSNAENALLSLEASPLLDLSILQRPSGRPPRWVTPRNFLDAGSDYCRRARSMIGVTAGAHRRGTS